MSMIKTLIFGRPEGIRQKLFARVSKLFDEEEMVALTFAVVVINAWNRLSISFRVPPGSYQPVQKQTVAV